MLLCWSCAGDKEGPSRHVGYRGFSFSSSSPHLNEEQGRGFVIPLERLRWREGLCSQSFVTEMDVSNSLHRHGCVSVVAHRYALCSPSLPLRASAQPWDDAGAAAALVFWGLWGALG